MKKFTITDSDGVTYPGLLPESWAEVPLSKYVTLSHAPGLTAQAQALADLCQLTPGILEQDMRLMASIVQAAPWLFNGALPAPAIAAPEYFTHQGVTYVPAPANLDKVNGDQMAALLTYLSDYGNDPTKCAPSLLAILYKPQGKKPLFGKAQEVALTADVAEASAQAFATLPMSVAWPLLQAFLVRSTPTALLIQKYSAAARPAVEMMLNALEIPLRTSGRPGFYWSLLRFLLSRWTQRARKMLATSSPHSAFTALLPNSSNKPLTNAGHE